MSALASDCAASQESKVQEQWQEEIRKVPVPKKGCFTRHIQIRNGRKFLRSTVKVSQSAARDPDPTS